MTQIFSKKANKVPPLILSILIILVIIIVFVFTYWFSPKSLEVGYRPEQPVAYSHELHAGRLAIDCRYCHTGVETTAHAGVPPTQTCMNCHNHLKKGETFKLSKVFESWKKDISIPWVRVHKTPDYAYFNHSAHIKVGVGCIECHGRVDKMEVVRQEKPLNMEWCLNCHRNPENALRPPEKITDMNWIASQEWKDIAHEKSKDLNPPIVSCSGCHR